MRFGSLVYVTDSDFTWRAKEVLRDVGERPHLLLRVDVNGPHFPHLDTIPFVRIVRRRDTVEALMTDVADSQDHLRAYFPTDVNLTGTLEFGYGSQVLGSLPLSRESRLAVTRLDDDKIRDRYHRVTEKELGAFRRAAPAVGPSSVSQS